MKNPLLSKSIKCYGLLIGGGSHLQSIVLLIFRLAWGWELLESGYGHLTHIQKTVSFFTQLGIPHPLANTYISGTTELVGGALLTVGLLSRLISIPLIFNFCIAYLTASHDEVVHFFRQDPSNFIDDAAFPFLITSLLILAFGPGKISLDWLLARFFLRGKGSPSPSRKPS